MAGGGATGGVRVVDRGANRLLRNLKGARGASTVLDLGVIGDDASAVEHDSEITVGELATIHELGLGVPERPWLRGYIEANRGKIEERIREEARRMITVGATRDQVLERLGVWLQGEIQEWIGNPGNNLAPNAPETILRKGSAMPLIDTGQFRSSITYKVRSAAEGG